ncbi:MAG: sugar 3,4-ketoisomerase [Alcaligenes sp.]
MNASQIAGPAALLPHGLAGEDLGYGRELIEWVRFTALGDERGSLVALEGTKSVPFPIKRVYYLFATKEGVARGFHAHINLRQVAICVTGSCRMVLDDGCRREEVLLRSPVQGVLLREMVWREMHDFSPDCVLLVLASEHYDESDYIRNYQDFLALREQMNPMSQTGGM